MKPEQEYKAASTNKQVDDKAKQQKPKSNGDDNMFKTFTKMDESTRSKIYVAGAAVLAVVLMFVMFPSKTKTPKPQEFKPAVTSAPAPISRPVAQTETINYSAQIQKVQDTIAAELKNLHTEQVDIQPLTNSFASLENLITNVMQKLNKLTDEQNKIAMDIELIKEHLLPNEEQSVNTIAEPAVKEFSIIGMIHGRAWIESQDNESITIKIGDNLPGYGSVTLIDLDEGIVATSSGKVITYPNK